MSNLNLLFMIIFLIANVDLMAINGPVETRYDPCGLGVVHFDRISNNRWLGVLHLGLYRNLMEVEIGIRFGKKVIITEATQNSTVLMKDDWHSYVIRPKGFPPKQYVFHLTVDSVQINDTDVPTVTQFSLNDVILCDDNIKRAQTLESLELPKSDTYNRHVCGRRALNHTELVSVRTQAEAGEWPWHVAIYIEDPITAETTYFCGGNIISKTAVLTAGHCVHMYGMEISAGGITVVAGVSNLGDTTHIGRQRLTASKVILHPSYVGDLATADLAIIKVHSFKYTEYVQPICIWGPVYNKASLFGHQGTVVGFGHDNDDKPSEVLRSAYIEVQNDTTCLRYSPGVYRDLLNEFSFCAGYGPESGTNPRNGDSGGGLVFPMMQTDHKVSWFLRGVLSKCGVAPGRTECDPTFYVVYTDVGPHYGWIYHHSGMEYQSNVV